MKLLAALFVLTFATGVNSSFNETFAKYFMWPMAASAYSDHPELCVKDNFKQSDFKRKIEVQCDLLKEDKCAAFTAVSHSDKAIILSFRGSVDAEVSQEVIDAIIVLPISEFSGKAKVNQYFYDAFNDLWNAGIKNDFLSLKNANPGYELWITGHSLGQPYLECDEDESKNCSDSVLDLSIGDHSLYYSVTTAFTSNGCKGWNPFNQ
uniref:Fungal lipase-like domain-containing protein n=1 Tax=Panagrolaimus sp. ES5 TaxID=591445 RepID=A0AC34G7W5_9BILA